MEKTYFIDHDYDKTRIDRWFKKKVCQVPQSLIQKIIRKGKSAIGSAGAAQSKNRDSD